MFTLFYVLGNVMSLNDAWGRMGHNGLLDKGGRVLLKLLILVPQVSSACVFREVKSAKQQS